MPSYQVECHRVWVRTVEADSREEARRVAEDEMSEEPDAEDYSYSVVRSGRTARLTEDKELTTDKLNGRG